MILARGEETMKKKKVKDVDTLPEKGWVKDNPDFIGTHEERRLEH